MRLTASEAASTLPPLVWRVLTAILGCGTLAWGLSNLSRAASVDEFQNFETRLLQFETFNTAAATSLLESPDAQALSPCDTHAQRPLLLLETPLADAALRSGEVRDFEQHLRSIETRARQIVACAPRDPLVWIVLFGLEVEHGRLDGHAFDLLAISYEVSPNEAWVAVRRTAVAVPVLLAAPAPVQQRILTEFANLIRHRFVDVPARSYASASDAVRALLQQQVDQLDEASKNAFTDALDKLRA